MIDLRFVPIVTPLQPLTRYKPSPFQVGFLKILDELEWELKTLSAKEIIIAADLPAHLIRNDGWPRGDAQPATPGLRLMFESRHGPLRYECATYAHWHGNLRAIGLTLTAQRAMERYGAVRSGQQYAGWTSLPPGPSSIKLNAFATVETAARFLIDTAGLGLRDPAAMVERLINDPGILQTHFRAAVIRTHPDKPGGSKDEFSKVAAAKEMIEAEQARKAGA